MSERTSTAQRVALRFVRGLTTAANVPPGIAAELEMALDIPPSIAAEIATEEQLAFKPRRRQRGIKKRVRQKTYRRTKQKSKRQSQKWRKRNPSKVKRYRRKRKLNPKRHRLRMAEVEKPFWDLEHGQEGEVTSINPEEETLQAMVNGQPKEYGVFGFLDTAVFLSEEGESAFFNVLDDAYDAEPLEEGDGTERQARELSMVWMVRDPLPARDYHGPQWEDSVFKMSLEAFVKYLSKVGVAVWNRDNAALHDDQSSAVKDAKARFDQWQHRYDISRVLKQARP